MPKHITPRTFLIAQTQVFHLGLEEALKALEVPKWNTDAATDAEALIEFAGKSCYMSFSLDLNKNLTETDIQNNFDYIQQGIVAAERGSVLEHATCTFFIHGVSRVLARELVEHRAGTAFSQTSEQYVRTDEINYWVPSEIRGTPAEGFFHAAFVQMEKWQAQLVGVFNVDVLKDFALKKKLTSAFRRLIGGGQTNSIVFTANHRTLRHIIELRTSRHAEEEIRLVINQIFDIVSLLFPALYADAKLEMVDGYNEITFVVDPIPPK